MHPGLEKIGIEPHQIQAELRRSTLEIDVNPFHAKRRVAMIKPLGCEHLPVVTPAELVDLMFWHQILFSRTETGIDETSSNV